MKILVTGGAGFVGSHVAESYLRAGHGVSVLDDLSRGVKANLHPEIRLYTGDICDREFVERVFVQEKPEVVNHHAAQMDVRRGVREPLFDATVNILGSLNVLEAAMANGCKRVLYISSAGAAYGEPKRLPVSEEDPILPITPYGISKHTVEHYLFTFSHLYGLSYVVLRYGNVYGPRQSSFGEAGVFAVFCEQMLAGMQPVIYGDGSKIRDYVFIEDVVEANLMALEKGDGEIFNIASDEATTDYEVFCLVRDQFGLQGLEPSYTAVRPGEIDKIRLDISKAQRLLGWRPNVPLQEGARRTAEYFKQVNASHPAKSLAATPGDSSLCGR